MAVCSSRCAKERSLLTSMARKMSLQWEVFEVDCAMQSTSLLEKLEHESGRYERRD